MTNVLRTYETSINERYIEVATKALKMGGC